MESGDGALASLTARLAEREQVLVIVGARRREVEEQAGRKEKLPSEAKLLEQVVSREVGHRRHGAFLAGTGGRQL